MSDLLQYFSRRSGLRKGHVYIGQPSFTGHMHAHCCPDTMIFVDMINREVSEWEGRLSAIRNILQDIVDTIHGGGMLSDSQDSICCCLVGNSTPECWSVSIIIICMQLLYTCNAFSLESRIPQLCT